MDVKEHLFSYDPFDGHSDKMTNSEGFQYFFLGNGQVQAALQYNKSPIGSPMGLLLMDPTKFGKKSDAFSYDDICGLERTIIDIKISGKSFSPNYLNLRMRWDREMDYPVVVAEWLAGQITVREEYFCSHSNLPNIIRNVSLINNSEKKIQGEFFIDMNISEKTNYKKRKFQFTILPNNDRIFSFIYAIDKNIHGVVYVENTEKYELDHGITKYWSKINKISFDNDRFNHLFSCSRNQINSIISESGQMDASIWQYNLEWVRDSSNVALGCIFSGHFELAKKILTRLLLEFVNEDGSTVDSSHKRDLSEVELDQNGILLYAIWLYWVWTNDDYMIKNFWIKIKSVADFPLQEIFWDKHTRLLKNCREFWERHQAYGVTHGYELTYQLYPIIGLTKIAEIAEHLGETEQAKKWRSASEEITKSFLSHPKYSLIDNGKFIKRRKISGEVHEIFEVPDKSFIADGITLKEEPINYCEPDTSESLPIVFEVIDPKSSIALSTLANLEKLWNQRWNLGGYGRYNASSEPDSVGPWPFATVFMARAYLENENPEKVKRILNWMYARSSESGSWFEFHGWRPSPPAPPTGLIPWTWAELITFFINHFLGIRPQRDHIIIRPKILDLSEKIEAKIRIRNQFIHLKISKSESNENSHAIIDKSEKIEMKNGDLILPYREQDYYIQIII